LLNKLLKECNRPSGQKRACFIQYDLLIAKQPLVASSILNARAEQTGLYAYFDGRRLIAELILR
jgi:hypothetical protein